MQLHDDISAPLDIAIAARRDEVPGKKTPEGILTKLEGTKIGQIIDAIDDNAEKGLIEFGLMLLRLDATSAILIGNTIGNLARNTSLIASHDATVWAQVDASGVTIHCNNLPVQQALEGLKGHCILRKYAQKAKLWFGILIAPFTGNIRLGITFNSAWSQDDMMDEQTANMLPPVSIRGLHRKIGRTKKIGRNDKCSCGSGIKYKKCCGRAS